MKFFNLLSVFSVLLVLSGCNGLGPTYTNQSTDYVLARHILVKSEYKAKEIIRRLDSSSNPHAAFIDIAKNESEGDEQITLRTNGGSLGWFGSMKMVSSIDKELFQMKPGTYSKSPVKTVWGYHVLYLEQKLTAQEYAKMINDDKQKNLDRIAAYETNYINEHNNILKNKPEYKVAYVQPKNKKEPCKIYMGYPEGNEYFKENSWKVFWDGSCENGYATGLGREIEQADMRDKWQIGIYKKGKASNYIIKKDVLNNTLTEGLENDDISFLVVTDIKVKQNDIDVTTIAGEINRKTGINLLATNSPFWNGTYQFEKDYMGFRYMYLNAQANDLSNLELGFFIETQKNGNNGWGFSKYRNRTLVSGEWINNKFSQLNLPKKYNDKADAIIKEINTAQQKAYQAQEQAKLMKKQYLKKICKDSVKVSFIDNDEYKDICNPKSELALMQKINEKLNKLTEAKIAKLEKERYTAQQQKEEQYRQQQLAIERQRLNEQRRANKEAEDDRDYATIQQGLKNTTDSINNMIPKTYNLNVFHY